MLIVPLPVVTLPFALVCPAVIKPEEDSRLNVKSLMVLVKSKSIAPELV